MGNPYKYYTINQEIMDMYEKLDEAFKILVEAFGDSFETYMNRKHRPEYNTITKFCMGRLFGAMDFDFDLHKSTEWQTTGWIANPPLQMTWMTFIVLRIAYENEKCTDETSEYVFGERTNVLKYTNMIKALYDERIRSWSDIIHFTAINTVINRLRIFGFITDATDIYSITLTNSGKVFLWDLEYEIAKATEVFG